MISLGLDNQSKRERINAYVSGHGIEKIKIFSPAKFRFECEEAEQIEYTAIIQYKYFYRLLQEIDDKTLIVINECLRTQNRSDLTYNCLRHYLNQTSHQLIFQYLPLIDKVEDLIVLFDFDTRSRWRREPFNAELLKHSAIEVTRRTPGFLALLVPIDARTRQLYEEKKTELLAGLGLRDPHTLPRNLYLFSGRARLACVDASAWYVGRNNRFKIQRMQSFRDGCYRFAPYTVFEFCHNLIDFADFMTLSHQLEFTVLAADLKVDQWYLQRYREWASRISDAYTAIQGH